MASVSEPYALMAHTGFLIKPLGFSFASYQKAFEHPLLLPSFSNTVFIVVVGVTINIFMTSLRHIFFRAHRVLWQRPIAFAIIFTMYFSGGIIPLYFTVTGYGLYNKFVVADFADCD